MKSKVCLIIEDIIKHNKSIEILEHFNLELVKKSIEDRSLVSKYTLKNVNLLKILKFMSERGVSLKLPISEIIDFVFSLNKKTFHNEELIEYIDALKKLDSSFEFILNLKNHKKKVKKLNENEMYIIEYLFNETLFYQKLHPDTLYDLLNLNPDLDSKSKAIIKLKSIIMIESILSKEEIKKHLRDNIDKLPNELMPYFFKKLIKSQNLIDAFLDLKLKVSKDYYKESNDFEILIFDTPTQSRLKFSIKHLISHNPNNLFKLYKRFSDLIISESIAKKLKESDFKFYELKNIGRSFIDPKLRDLKIFKLYRSVFDQKKKKILISNEEIYFLKKNKYIAKHIIYRLRKKSRKINNIENLSYLLDILYEVYERPKKITNNMIGAYVSASFAISKLKRLIFEMIKNGYDLKSLDLFLKSKNSKIKDDLFSKKDLSELILILKSLNEKELISTLYRLQNYLSFYQFESILYELKKSIVLDPYELYQNKTDRSYLLIQKITKLFKNNDSILSYFKFKTPENIFSFLNGISSDSDKLDILSLISNYDLADPNHILDILNIFYYNKNKSIQEEIYIEKFYKDLIDKCFQLNVNRIPIEIRKKYLKKFVHKKKKHRKLI